MTVVTQSDSVLNRASGTDHNVRTHHNPNRVEDAEALTDCGVRADIRAGQHLRQLLQKDGGGGMATRQRSREPVSNERDRLRSGRQSENKESLRDRCV